MSRPAGTGPGLYKQIVVTKTTRARYLKFWHNVHHPLCVMWHMSCFTFHMSYVRCQVSHVRCHMSSVTCHLLLPNHKSKGAEILREGALPPTFDLSYVMCHVSQVTCHMSHITCNFFFCGTKCCSYSVEGLLSTGPTLSSFLWLHQFLNQFWNC